MKFVVFTWCVDLPRPRKRLTELILKTVKGDEGRRKANKQWGFRFLRSPVEVLPDADGTKVAGIRLAVNKLEVRIYASGPVLASLQKLTQLYSSWDWLRSVIRGFLDITV